MLQLTTYNLRLSTYNLRLQTSYLFWVEWLEKAARLRRRAATTKPTTDPDIRSRKWLLVTWLLGCNNKTKF